MHDRYCELKSALNLKAEEEALDHENPFENMQKSISNVDTSALQGDHDDDGGGHTDVDELPDDEEKEDMNDVDFDSLAGPIS